MKTIPNQTTEYFGYFNEVMSWDQMRNAQHWVNALRSGHFRQSREGKLKCDTLHGRGFCCLGVADSLLGGESILQNNFTLTREVRHKLGLWMGSGSGAAKFGHSDGVPTAPALSYLNDGLGWTFEDIAQLIEDQLKFSTVAP